MSDAAVSPETIEAAAPATPSRAQAWADAVTAVLGGVGEVSVALDEVNVDVPAEQYLELMQKLHDDASTRLDLLVDLCGMDYSEYADGDWDKPRFAAVLHLLSVTQNQRLRVRVFCADDAFPVLPSVCSVWTSANWYEREAFDMFGMIFEGHPDLRRLLTDYGFIGHPLRKDFPVSGSVEMRYDPEQKRVIYQAITIEPRELTPRIRREAGFGQ